MVDNRDENTVGESGAVSSLVQDHKEPENIEQMVAAPEATEFLDEKEIKEMGPKEKIAIWMAQQEHKNPGFIEGHLEKHGMMKFSDGHYVMYSKPGAKSLPRIWAPGEYEADKKKNFYPGDMGALKRAFVKSIVDGIKRENFKASRKAKTSTGKVVHFGEANAKNWDDKYGNFSAEEHNEAAKIHLDEALHAHMAKKTEARDAHLTDAVEHISRAGKASTHHKLYSKLLDKFYD